MLHVTFNMICSFKLHQYALLVRDTFIFIPASRTAEADIECVVDRGRGVGVGKGKEFL